ncbi:MAG: DUF1302 family protein [Pseudomonadota bacterium]
MMRALLFAVLACCLNPVYGARVDLAELNTRLTYRYASTIDERLAGELELAPRLELGLTQKLSAVLSARIRGDSDDRLIPGEPDRRSYSHASRPVPLGDDGIAELRDAYLRWRGDSFSVRLGKQQLVWGSLDGIKVLDVLNPQSFEQFILEDFDQSRIPLWSAHTEFSAFNWRIEAALIADDTSHFIPDPEAWMAFQAPRFRFGARPSDDLPPIRQVPAEGQRGTLGVRLARTLGSTDVELVAVSGRDHEPLGRVVAGGDEPTLELFTTRRDTYGFSLQRSIAQSVVRVEAAWMPERTFNVAQGVGLSTVEQDNWRAAVGFDVNAPAGVFVNLQYLHDEVRTPSPALVRDTRERVLTATLRRGFAYETVQAELQFFHGVDYDDTMRRANLDYQFSDRVRLSLSLVQFRGDLLGPFGQFAGRDQVAATWTLTL